MITPQDATVELYDKIIRKIKEAQESGNTRTLKLWRNKLDQWGNAYGAYAPIRRS